MGEWWDLIPHWTFFLIMFGGAIFAAGVIFVLLPWLRSAMPPED